MGTVRRRISSLVFNDDGDWIYAGTDAGDVMSVNVKRNAIQVSVSANAYLGVHELFTSESLIRFIHQ